jgi:hypothetical protein
MRPLLGSTLAAFVGTVLMAAEHPVPVSASDPSPAQLYAPPLEILHEMDSQWATYGVSVAAGASDTSAFVGSEVLTTVDTASGQTARIADVRDISDLHRSGDALYVGEPGRMSVYSVTPGVTDLRSRLALPGGLSHTPQLYFVAEIDDQMLVVLGSGYDLALVAVDTSDSGRLQAVGEPSLLAIGGRESLAASASHAEALYLVVNSYGIGPGNVLSSKLRVFAAQRSSAPRAILTLNQDVALRSLATFGNHLYAGYSSPEGWATMAFDISDPLNPKEIARVPGSYWPSIIVDGVGFASDGEALSMYALTDGGTPALRDEVRLSGACGYVVADRAAVRTICRTDFRHWLHVIPWTEDGFGTPLPPASVPAFWRTSGPGVIEGRLVAAPAMGDGVHLAEIVDRPGGVSGELVTAGAWPEPAAHVALMGGRLITAWHDAIELVSLEDPMNPVRADRLELGEPVAGLSAGADQFLAMHGSSIALLTVENGRFVPLASVAAALPSSLAIDGRWAAALEHPAHESTRVGLFEVDDTTIRRRYTIDVPGDSWSIAVAGSRVYIVGSEIVTLAVGEDVEVASSSALGLGAKSSYQGVAAFEKYLAIPLPSASGRDAGVYVSDMQEPSAPVLTGATPLAGDLSIDGQLILRTRPNSLSVFSVAELPAAWAYLSPTCGVTTSTPAVITGIASPDVERVAVTVNRPPQVDADVIDGRFSVAAHLTLGFNSIAVDPVSSRGHWSSARGRLTLNPSSMLDPYGTLIESVRNSAPSLGPSPHRPFDWESCVTFRGEWSISAPTGEPILLKTRAPAGATVTATLGGLELEFAEVAPGEFAAEAPLFDPDDGLRLVLEVFHSDSSQRVEGALLLRRSFLPGLVTKAKR